jgi:hypothetical protein
VDIPSAGDQGGAVKPRFCDDSYIYRGTCGRTGIFISNCTCAGCQCIGGKCRRNARKLASGGDGFAGHRAQCRHQAIGSGICLRNGSNRSQTRTQRFKQSVTGVSTGGRSQCRGTACTGTSGCGYRPGT